MALLCVHMGLYPLRLKVYDVTCRTLCDLVQDLLTCETEPQRKPTVILDAIRALVPARN